MKALQPEKYAVRVKVLTGLHIGAGNDLVQIGGIDQVVVKTQAGDPFIPGSSLKGKLRSLYELRTGIIEEDTKDGKSKEGIHFYCGDKKCRVCRFFGIGGFDKEKTTRETEEKEAEKLGPTRFLFRDLALSEEDRIRFAELKQRGIQPLESKLEVAINRHTGVGSNPRPIERVPAGTVFEGELIVRKFEVFPEKKEWQDDELLAPKGEKTFLEMLAQLLNDDYLGGSGSRGSGQVEITFTKKI